MFAAHAALLTPPAAAAPSGTHLTDNFTRADNATDLGTNWTNRNAVMGISSNTAIPKTNNNYCMATHNTVMTADDMTVSITLAALVGSGVSRSYVALGANSGGTIYAALWCDTVASSLQIFSVTSWNIIASFTSQASSTVAFTTADVVALRRVGNVYTALKNGASTGVSWTDAGNVVTRGSSNRIVGCGGLTSSGSARPLSAFAADSA